MAGEIKERSVNSFGDRMLGIASDVHKSLNLRSIAERMDPQGTFKKIMRGGPKSPSPNLDETRQLEQLRQMKE